MYCTLSVSVSNLPYLAAHEQNVSGVMTPVRAELHPCAYRAREDPPEEACDGNQALREVQVENQVLGGSTEVGGSQIWRSGRVEGVALSSAAGKMVAVERESPGVMAVWLVVLSSVVERLRDPGAGSAEPEILQKCSEPETAVWQGCLGGSTVQAYQLWAGLMMATARVAAVLAVTWKTNLACFPEMV